VRNPPSLGYSSRTLPASLSLDTMFPALPGAGAFSIADPQ
jgi:hypothetical protein